MYLVTFIAAPDWQFRGIWTNNLQVKGVFIEPNRLQPPPHMSLCYWLYLTFPPCTAIHPVQSSSSSLTCSVCRLCVSGVDIHHQRLSGGGWEASDGVTVLPGHRYRKPELPQRRGVQSPAEGDPLVQPQKNSSPSERGGHRCSPEWRPNCGCEFSFCWRRRV